MISYINSASFIVSYGKTIMNHRTPEESFQYADENKTKPTWNRNYLLDNINHRRTWESNKTIEKKCLIITSDTLLLLFFSCFDNVSTK